MTSQHSGSCYLISPLKFTGVENTDIFLNSFDNLSALGVVKVDILAANNKNLFSGETDETGRVSVPNSLLRVPVLPQNL